MQRALPQRLQKAIKWLIAEGYAKNQKEIAEKLNYTRSMFNFLYNGRNPIADRVWLGLYDIDNRLNLDWLRRGEGEMLDTIQYVEDSKGNMNRFATNNGNTKLYISETSTINDLVEMLKKKDEQITELIILLKQQSKNITP